MSEEDEEVRYMVSAIAAPHSRRKNNNNCLGQDDTQQSSGWDGMAWDAKSVWVIDLLNQ